MMKFGVRVMPREEILDSQGRAVEKVLRFSHKGLLGCRVGKYMEIELEGDDEKGALSEIKKMAESVLHNPLIEVYDVQRIS